jgi:hypothetical protein
MEVSNKVAITVIASVIVLIIVYSLCAKRDNFTRTCGTADQNCQFARSPVDYAFVSQTEVPEKKGMLFPHMMADPTDKTFPLEDYPINLIRDEDKLWDPKKLWVQYENDYPGCGNGQPYIVNDETTRFNLVDVGDFWAERILNSQSSWPKGNALTDQDIIQPEPFGRLYGGSGFLNNAIGD